MTCARHIGRVGALAIALGIGAAVANGPGVAHADPDTGSMTSGSDTSAPEVGPDDDATEQTTDGDSDRPAPSTTDAPTTSVSSSGGALTSTHGTVDDDATEPDEPAPTDGRPARPDYSRGNDGSAHESTAARTKTPSATAPRAVMSATRSDPAPAAIRTQPVRSGDAPPSGPTAVSDPASETPSSGPPVGANASVTAPAVATRAPAPAAQTPAPTAQAPVTMWLSGLLGAFGLAPATNSTDTPESPVLWGVLAWVRGRTTVVAEPRAAAGTGTGTGTGEDVGSGGGLAAVTAGAAPTATPIVGDPAAADGKVPGSVAGLDPDGNPVTYSLSGGPSHGTVVLTSAGAFEYTPAQAARLRAGVTPGPDTDAFTVTVSDGTASTAVVVSVPISPAAFNGPVSGSTGSGSNPSAAVVVPGRGVYVANTARNTVTVHDPVTGAVLKTINVGGAPSAVATDGVSVWVANTNSNTVTRIRTSDNTVIATTTVGWAPRALVVAPNGGSVWVANTSGDSISRISTATNRVVSTTAVGRTPSALAVSADGASVWAVNTGSYSVSRISAATNTVTATIGVGRAPSSIAVGSGYVFVTNQGDKTVTPIAIADNVLRPVIALGAVPAAVTSSPDGTVVYVANTNDTVTVIDARSRTVVRTLTVDPVAETGAHGVTATGTRLYVTDGVDGALRIMTMAKINSAPLAGTPTVGAPDPTSGVVTGTLNVRDIDGNPLTYQVIGQPPNDSTVEVTQAGAFTFTPGAVARTLASQTQGSDAVTFTVRVGDGTTFTDVTVTGVTVLPASTSATTVAIPTGNGPSGVVVAAGKVYVVNTDGRTVTVYGSSGELLQTISTIGSPLGIAASASGDRVYVSAGPDQYYLPEITDRNTVLVIDTATDTVVRTVGIVVEPTFNPEVGELLNTVADLTVAPDGSRVYVAATDGSVSVVDTTTFAVTRHTGGSYADMAFGPGGLLFTTAPSGGGIGVTAPSMVQTGSITVGPTWDLDAMSSEFTAGTYNVVASPDGRHLYVTYGVTTVARGTGGHTSGVFITDSRGQNWKVTGGYSAVAVIDTDPQHVDSHLKQVDTIRVEHGAQDIALTSDGRYAYVTGWDGMTVTRIDLGTRTVVGSYTTDQSAGTARSLTFYGERYFDRFVTVGPDGTVYVTDYRDEMVYVAATWSTGSPTGIAVDA